MCALLRLQSVGIYGKSILYDGGTLHSDSPGYVQRSADQQLFDSLVAGEFCYVLDSRQKGKSSLVSRVLSRLEAAGVATATIDLQRFGTNLDAERWYAGLLNAVAESLVRSANLDLTGQIFEYWGSHQRFGPLERWMRILQKVVLPALGRQKLVIFVDEIDFVRSLPFDTDEFFAGIRECYNRRSEDPELERLTFCLLGVATPSDLIRDVRITPFNVGRRIDLTDFTLAESMTLTTGFVEAGRTPNQSEALVRRIHHWTNGHPYLTQKLCAAVAADPKLTTSSGVDRLVEQTFFTQKSREEEPNLRDVSRRVLETPLEGLTPEESRARILDLFRQVRENRKVRDDDTDPVASVLKLAGLTTVLGGYLLVRNKVYFRVFDHAWIEAGMPDAELIRQRTAVRRATLRTALVAGAVVLAIGSLAGYSWRMARQREGALLSAKAALKSADTERSKAVNALAAARIATDKEAVASKQASMNASAAIDQSKKAKVQAQAADVAKGVAKQEAFKATRLAYDADMTLIQSAYDRGDIPTVRSLLAETGKSVFRGIEWGYWDRLLNQQLSDFPANWAPEWNAWSPDGSKFASVPASGDRVVLRSAFDGAVLSQHGISPGREVAILGYQRSRLVAITAPSQRSKATHAGSSTTQQSEYRVEDIFNNKTMAILKMAGPAPTQWLFSKDGSLIVAIAEPRVDQCVFTLWNWPKTKSIHLTARLTGSIHGVGLSPDDNLLAFDDDNGVQVWSISNNRKLAQFPDHTIYGILFSPDGSKLLTYSYSNLHVRDARTGKILARHAFASASFSTSGTTVVVHDSQSVRLWNFNVTPGDALAKKDEAYLLTDGKHSLDTRNDGYEYFEGLTIGGNFLAPLAVSTAGSCVATSTRYDNVIHIWGAADGKQLASFIANDRPFRLSFSPTGTRLLSWNQEGSCQLWDASAKRLTSDFAPMDGLAKAVFAKDGTTFKVAGPGVTTTWSAWNGSLMTSTRMPTADNLLLSSDGSRIISTVGNRFRVVNTSSGKNVWDGAIGVAGTQVDLRKCCSFSANGSFAAVLTAPSVIRGLNLSTGHQTCLIRNRSESLSVSPLGSQLCVGDSVYSTANGKLLFRLKPKLNIDTVSFTANGTRLVAASATGEVAFFDATTGRLLSEKSFAVPKVLSSYFASKYRPAVSADGLMVFTRSQSDSQSGVVPDTTASSFFVWVLRLPQPVQLRGDVSKIEEGTFSQDGTRLMTTGTDNVLRIWNPTTGGLLLNVADVTTSVWHFGKQTRAVALGGPGSSRILYFSRNDGPSPLLGRDWLEREANSDRLGGWVSAKSNGWSSGTAATYLTSLISSDPDSNKLRAIRLQSSLAALGDNQPSDRSEMTKWIADDSRRVSSNVVTQLSPADRILMYGSLVTYTRRVPDVDARRRLQTLLAWLVQVDPNLVLGTHDVPNSLETISLLPDGNLARGLYRSIRSELGEPSPAAGDQSKANWLAYGFLAIRLGDKGQWVATVKRLEDASGDGDWDTCGTIARLGAGPIDLERILKNMESDDAKGQGGGGLGSSSDHLTEGALLYRIGSFEEALSKLVFSFEDANVFTATPTDHVFEMERDHGGDVPIIELYMAMALAKQGHASTARSILAETERWANDRLGYEGNEDWTHEIEIKLLLDEAHKVILEK